MKKDGIACPVCASKLHEISETRKDHGSLKRTRECFNGHKFITVEVVLGVPKVKRVGLRVAG